MKTENTDLNVTNSKNRIVIKDISKKQKEALKTGSVGLAGIITGVSFFSLFGSERLLAKNIVSNQDISNEEMMAEDCIELETEIPFANTVTDELSFSEAFAAARKEMGAGGFFEWQGNTYNTYYKEEWDELGEEAQDEFIASVIEQTNTEDIHDYNSEEDLVTDFEVVEDTESDTNLDLNESELIIEEEDTHTLDSEVIQENPEVGWLDENNDDHLDGYVEDLDQDGYVDTVVVDLNYDGNPDALAVDSDNDNDIDVVIIDEGQDGLDENDNVYNIDEPVVLKMDELDMVDEKDYFEEDTSNDDQQLDQDLLGSLDEDPLII